MPTKPENRDYKAEAARESPKRQQDRRDRMKARYDYEKKHGDLPTNTDGGGLSSNHPGMRGIFLMIEATRQLRGGMGDRQVRDCEIAVCHGTGGSLSLQHSGITLLLTNR